jgi:hypothetical protein
MRLRKPIFSRRGLMVSTADRAAATPLAGAADAAQNSAPAAVVTPAVSLAAGERELRIDLFRGLALWLIFIDHLSPDLLTWFTIRNYGFCDAAEIFIFISGYTAAFVYGRAMRESGFMIASVRILRRVWQIYVAHVFIVIIFLGEIEYAVTSSENPFFSQEMRVVDFIQHPGAVLLQTLLLRFRPLNIDVLPLYVVLMFFLPVILWLMKWRADVTLALSVALYALTLHYDWYLSAYPGGYWAFNPFAWQMLFVFGAWCALGGARRMSGFLASPITLWISVAYVVAAFCVTLTWYFPQLEHLLPSRLAQWMYPIDKTDMDILRFAHFLALAAITMRFVPKGWPGLQSPWLRPLILCGTYSLEIFCLGVFLAFAGYFVLVELDGGIFMHLLVALIGILIMCAVAWVNSWYRRTDDRNTSRIGGTGGNADIVGGR